MPGKSRRRKGKYAIQSKSEGRAGSSNLSVQQPVDTQGHQPVPSPVVPAPSAKIAVLTAKPEVPRYLYITSELWTIGILAGIMLIGLVLLAQILG
ncbi:hypothetical protein ACFLVC_02150 [Chloroflexota bacterium]